MGLVFVSASLTVVFDCPRRVNGAHARATSVAMAARTRSWRASRRSWRARARRRCSGTRNSRSASSSSGRHPAFRSRRPRRNSARLWLHVPWSGLAPRHSVLGRSDSHGFQASPRTPSAHEGLHHRHASHLYGRRGSGVAAASALDDASQGHYVPVSADRLALLSRRGLRLASAGQTPLTPSRPQLTTHDEGPKEVQ